MPLGCRFYEHRFPEIEDVVMVNVREIQDVGAYVHLLEYNNIEGMVLLSELSRRRIRSINKLIRVGRSECVVVIRVDRDKGYIDLSKRRVSEEEAAQCEEKFANGRCVNSILRHVGELLGYESDDQLEELYQKTAWHFDRKYGKPGSSFEAFKHAVTNPEILDECDIDDHTKKVLLTNIKRRMAPQAVKIRADLEVVCYGYEGIDAVKNALRAGLNYSTEDMPIKINLIAPPLYVMTTRTLEKSDGLKVMQEALVKIEEVIKQNGGVFSLKMAPKVVSDTDEVQLEKQLSDLAAKNQEVCGDDDADSFSDDDGDSASDKGDDGTEDMEP